MVMKLSKLTVEDYDRAAAFWKETAGLGTVCIESREQFATFLQRNPGLSFKLADQEAIVGTVLCGHDGTRGYLHHIALALPYRGQGMSKMLVDKSLEELRSTGIRRCHFFIDPMNGEGERMLPTLEWTEERGVKVFTHDIELPAR